VNEITRLLQALQNGQANGADELLELVYAELRRIAAFQMAREKSGHTLQPTALVHEAWMRLANEDGRISFQNRAHFFSVAGEAMRRILVDEARRKLAVRHGGGLVREDSDHIEIATPTPDDRLLAVNDALERLTAIDADKAEVVRLRYFVGMTLEETADVMGIAERTVRRHWDFARAWLLNSIRENA
jgi:RNA polymerase sigma factor (TIGR02999 family)